MTVVYFDEDFSDEVLQSVLKLNETMPGWIADKRREFVDFLRQMYDPALINNTGLVVMKGVLKQALLEANVYLLVVLVYLMTTKQEEIEVVKYMQPNLNIISLTDVSLLHHADFPPEFLYKVQNLVQTQFL